jgi:hypothetical protein
MTGSERWRWLRVSVAVVAGAETLFWLYTFYYIAARANPNGDGMEWLAAVPMTAIFLALTLPAVVFGVRRRAPWIGAVFAILSLGSNAVIWGEVVAEFSSIAAR